jgi:hypothetical protein
LTPGPPPRYLLWPARCPIAGRTDSQEPAK